MNKPSLKYHREILWRRQVMEDQGLKEYFKFDDADLEMNCNGQFSKKQIEILTEMRKEFSRGMRRTAIPFVLSAVMGPVSAIVERSMG
jgi:phenylalanyl-tRNA synthetase beta subunit